MDWKINLFHVRNRYSQFENMEFNDALWWAFVTATTVAMEIYLPQQVLEG